MIIQIINSFRKTKPVIRPQWLLGLRNKFYDVELAHTSTTYWLIKIPAHLLTTATDLEFHGERLVLNPNTHISFVPLDIYWSCWDMLTTVQTSWRVIQYNLSSMCFQPCKINVRKNVVECRAATNGYFSIN